METLETILTEHGIYEYDARLNAVVEQYADQFTNWNSPLDPWILIEDSEEMRMPPFEKKTQIICADGEQYIGYFNGADRTGYVWFCDNNDYHYPTHWRYLPTPPQPPIQTQQINKD